MIRLTDVSYRYNDSKSGVNNVTVEFMTNSINCIIGDSGAGKSTLLHCINGLLPITSGNIEVIDNGKPLSIHEVDTLTWTRKFGYVMQGGKLISHYNVNDNLLLPCKVNGVTVSDSRLKLIKDLFNQVNLPYTDEFLSKYPRELSGGQCQKLSIISTIICNKAHLLMDEPFSALDPLSISELEEILMKLKSKYRLTVVIITHDINKALDISDQILVMKNGRVAQLGSVNSVLTDPCSFIRDSVELYDGVVPTVPWYYSRRRALSIMGAHGVRHINVIQNGIASKISWDAIRNSLATYPNIDVPLGEIVGEPVV